MSDLQRVSTLLKRLESLNSHIDDIDNIMESILNNDVECTLDLTVLGLPVDPVEKSPVVIDMNKLSEDPSSFASYIKSRLSKVSEKVAEERERAKGKKFELPLLSNAAVSKILKIAVEELKEKIKAIEKELLDLGLTIS